MATSNVLVTRTGTSWTVDVTACDLDPNVTLKDFVALINGVVVTNADFAKTTATTLTYTGASLPANTQVEIRRRSPASKVSLAQLGSRVRSSDWDNEFTRVYKKFEEYDLNGAGSPATVQTPKDDPFGVLWDGDTTYPPTRNSVYDFLITRAPLVSPALSGAPTSTTPTAGDNSTRIATTAFIQSALTGYAPIASPNFTGNPTVPTPLDTENTTIIANTAWVRTRITNTLSNSPALGGTPTAPTATTGTSSTQIATTAFVQNTINALNLATTYAPINNAALTGTPTAPTAAYQTNTTQLATTAFINNKLRMSAQGLTATISGITASTVVSGWSTTNFLDRDSAFNRTTGIWTCPTSGYWRISFQVYVELQSGTPTGVTFAAVQDSSGLVNFAVVALTITTSYNDLGNASVVQYVAAGTQLRLNVIPGGGTLRVEQLNPRLSFEYVSP